MTQTSREPAQRTDVARPLGTWLSQGRSWIALFVADLRLAWSFTYVRHGLWGMILLAVAAMTPAFLPPDLGLLDRLGLTWVQTSVGALLSAGLILGGVALLLHAWLRLRPTPDRPTAPTSAWVLWSLPLLFVPPLFSRDAYSYAAQGLIVDRGMDPYTTGPISVPGEFADNVDPVWLFTPAPYGPLALQMQHAVVDATFGNAYVAAVAMRFPAILCVAVLAIALPKLAARYGVSEQGARWLGVLNPLVLMHLVGGAHNDAAMIALVVVGLLLAVDGRIVWASLTIAAAAGFKQTAIFALIAVAALSARQVWGTGHTFVQYLRESAKVGLVSFVGFAAVTALSGLGWGWLHNLSIPLQLVRCWPRRRCSARSPRRCWAARAPTRPPRGPCRSCSPSALSSPSASSRGCSCASPRRTRSEPRPAPSPSSSSAGRCCSPGTCCRCSPCSARAARTAAGCSSPCG